MYAATNHLKPMKPAYPLESQVALSKKRQVLYVHVSQSGEFPCKRVFGEVEFLRGNSKLPPSITKQYMLS